jgi:hypothetical protein
MPTRLQITTARRRALVAQSQALRVQLLAATDGIRASLGLGRLGASALRSVRRHPAIAIGMGLALLVAGPRRLLRVASLGMTALSLFGQVRRMTAAFGAVRRPH